MGGIIVASGSSSHNVVRPISNSVPEPPGTPEPAIPRRTRGSPEESKTKTH